MRAMTRKIERHKAMSIVFALVYGGGDLDYIENLSLEDIENLKELHKRFHTKNDSFTNND